MSGVVVIGSVLPCTNYSGGLFLAGILRSRAVPVAGYIAVQAKELVPRVPADLRDTVPMQVLHKISEFPDSPETLTGEGMRARELRRQQDIPAIAEHVFAFCERVEAAQIWIVLEGPTLIRLAHALLEAGRYPVRVQVMDPPGWQLRAAKIDPDTVGEVLELFDQTMSRAVACAAASWNMAKIYRDRYGIVTVPVVPALPAALARVPQPRKAGAAVKIGFAGQPYATDEFQALYAALAALNKDRSVGRVTLHVFTSWAIKPPSNVSGQVVMHEWTGQEELVPQLSEMDLLYCPYWFDPAYREETLLCFPSKLTSYLAAGRPILFHGRNDASPALFLRGGAAGFFCFRADADSLCHTIRMAMSDPDTYAERADNGHALFVRYLTEDRLADSVREFLTAGEATSI